MDSLKIEGKEYVSAKRAAREHSYAMDYVGQLIRGGKLIGKKVGRAWYVELNSLNTYIAALAGGKHESITPDILTEEVKKDETPESISAEQVPEIHIQASGEEGKIIPARKIETKKKEAPQRAVYHYPMLRYVQDEESEILPELTAQTINHRVSTEVQQEEESTINEGERSIAISVAPANLPYRQEIRARGEGVIRMPMHRASILPALIAVVAIALTLGVGGASILLSKTFTYDSATASVQAGFSYSGLYEISR